MAAEAWSSLGLLEIQMAAGDSAALGQAVADLERAIETATPGARPPRPLDGFLGFAHCQLGHTTEAENAYTSAIELAQTDSIPDYQTALERSRNRTSPENCS